MDICDLIFFNSNSPSMILYSLSIDKIPLFNKTDKKSRPKKESCVDPSSLSFYLPKTKYNLAINSLRPGLFQRIQFPQNFPPKRFTNLPIQARNTRIISISHMLHSCMRKRLRANEFRNHQKYNTRSSSCVRNQRENLPSFLPSFLSFLLKLVGSSRDNAQFFSKIYNSTSL